MDGIVALFAALQGYIGTVAGFGVDDSHSMASFFLVVSLAIIGALCLNYASERHDNVHSSMNFVTMFAGGVFGNALLRGMQLPFGNELVLTATLALFGMSVAALALLVTYSRTEI